MNSYLDALWQLLILVAICAIITSAVDLYPPSWNEVCRATTLDQKPSSRIELECIVSDNDGVILNFKELGEYTRLVKEHISYSVDIRCHYIGNISMVWPMKIEKLDSIKVTGCNIYDYISDFNKTDLTTKDYLTNLQIIDSVNVMDLSTLFRSLNNVSSISNEWHCGQDKTTQTLIMRNVSIDFFVSDPTALMSNPGKDPIGLINSIFDLKPMCVFENLTTLEETYAETFNVYHISVLSNNAKYPQLQYINYSHNVWPEITERFQDWRRTFRHLKYLDLSYNIISEVNLKNRFRVDADYDTVIDVSHNNITDLTIKELRAWSRLDNMFVDIRGNPIDCGCLKQDVISAIQDDNFFVDNLSKYKYVRDMTCASPDSASGVTLSTVTKAQMGCPIPPADLTIYLIIMSVIAAILILIIVAIFYFRKEIKIVLFVKFNVLLPWDVDKRKEEKVYDAFVSYSSGDEDWVYDYLQEKLENPSNEARTSFKLCLHQRDFIGGTSILDNIINSIENSRHTIVVLTKSFLASVWGMEEFKHAYYQSIVKKHRHLIIIKYEDVPKEMMDTTLKRCLKTFTYLDVNDKMFWDRLRFALAIKRRHEKSQVKVEKEHIDLTLPGPLIITDGPTDKVEETKTSTNEIILMPKPKLDMKVKTTKKLPRNTVQVKHPKDDVMLSNPGHNNAVSLQPVIMLPEKCLTDDTGVAMHTQMSSCSDDSGVVADFNYMPYTSPSMSF